MSLQIALSSLNSRVPSSELQTSQRQSKAQVIKYSRNNFRSLQKKLKQETMARKKAEKRKTDYLLASLRHKGEFPDEVLQNNINDKLKYDDVELNLIEKIRAHPKSKLLFGNDR